MPRQANDYPRWLCRYIGLDWEEAGRCWGLVQAIQKERGIALPDAQGRGYGLLRGLAAGTLPWREIGSQEAAFGDVALFRYELHVGFVLEAGTMLHVDQGGTSEITRYVGPAWGERLVGIWRYAAAH